MYHDTNSDLQALAAMGTDALAYMRELTAEEITEKFTHVDGLEAGVSYWALFAADGTPLMLAGNQHELQDSAFHNNLTAILPN